MQPFNARNAWNMQIKGCLLYLHTYAFHLFLPLGYFFHLLFHLFLPATPSTYLFRIHIWPTPTTYSCYLLLPPTHSTHSFQILHLSFSFLLLLPNTTSLVQAWINPSRGHPSSTYFLHLLFRPLLALTASSCLFFHRLLRPITLIFMVVEVVLVVRVVEVVVAVARLVMVTITSGSGSGGCGESGDNSSESGDGCVDSGYHRCKNRWPLE